MRHLIRAALTIAAVALPSIVTAQSGNPATGSTPPSREQAQARRDAMRERREQFKAMTPEERQAARAQMRERRENRGGAAGARERRGARLDNMSPEQQQFMRDLQAYRTGLRDKARELRGQVQAGTLTQDQMAQQLKAYRDANRPSRPATATPPSGSN
jgi:hypothetical protein